MHQGNTVLLMVGLVAGKEMKSYCPDKIIKQILVYYFGRNVYTVCGFFGILCQLMDQKREIGTCQSYLFRSLIVYFEVEQINILNILLLVLMR